jgi:5-methyltetrahydropteroyltriglutamate--homocysteine methyltransferase
VYTELLTKLAATGVKEVQIHEPVDAGAAWTKYRAALSADQKISERIASLTEADFCRAESFNARRPKQLEGMPLLPTTSIGSFPQTKEIRSLRNQFKRNKITKEQYQAAIDQQIAYMIGIQEGIGLDILVHGEPERTGKSISVPKSVCRSHNMFTYTLLHFFFQTWWSSLLSKWTA